MENVSDVLGDAVLSRARELAHESGKNILESISIVLNLCTIHGTAWLVDQEIVFPWFD